MVIPQCCVVGCNHRTDKRVTKAGTKPVDVFAHGASDLIFGNSEQHTHSLDQSSVEFEQTLHRHHDMSTMRSVFACPSPVCTTRSSSEPSRCYRDQMRLMRASARTCSLVLVLSDSVIQSPNRWNYYQTPLCIKLRAECFVYASSCHVQCERPSCKLSLAIVGSRDVTW